jgi:hypothetical protein
LRARAREEVESDLEALTLVAQETIRGDARVVEEHRAGVRGAEAELTLLSSRANTRIAAFEDERRDRAVELREHDRDLGDAAVRHVDLLAVQDVLVALAARRRADRREIRARMRLRERDRRERPLLA